MVRIIHELPQRLRLRLASRPEDLARASTAVRRAPGVTAVRINPGCAALTAAYDGLPQTRAKILALAANPPAGAAPWEQPESSDRHTLILTAASLFVSMMAPRPLAAAVTFVNVAGTILRGAAAATHGLKVEVLDALAIGLPTLRGEYVTANFTRFLVALAAYIESTTVERSDELLRSLLRQQPADVWVKRESGELERIPFAQLRGGEHVAVGVGETIPVDGEIIEGDAYVDQAAVTGESLPIPRAPGDVALAGGIITDGRLVIRADRVGDSTTTGRITRYIQEALERPAEIQSVSDAMADRRVGITLASAAGVLALTRDWRRLESVLMVDYSCTVKLGTPIALKSAMYRAARQGCLVKSGQAIEILAGVDTVVFDKTGTLTQNTLDVTDICPLRPDVDEDLAVAIVASLGEHTAHPIARAIVDLAQQRHLAHIPHEEVNFIVGHGVEGAVNGETVCFGSRHFLEDDEHISFAPQRALAAKLRAEGKSLLFAAQENRPLAVFALRDSLRAEALSTLSRLRALGVKRLVMITGDHRAKAIAFGDALGMDDVFYEQQPEDKARIIGELMAKGARVAYIGDGVNDGPALMAADVGVAMPRAADIARATADIVLIEDRLDSLATMLEVSQQTMRLIRSNFRVAVGANTAILIGAVAGLLPARVTATLHNGATIAVLIRSLLSNRVPTGSALIALPGQREPQRLGDKTGEQNEASVAV
ncbi:heavy metal translocating P-type ATPase [Methylocella silvestris BL2]|uniref:P-type Zn(2+) transporter n=1 Tax=Methylocella silvestris (strain DSM 15510 / CIP 108128 / LMG 27833 / NCIMB 13906 / BL2) TaxID=395965 RepID=B8ETH9_METSB|nr:heavy metal translocating P-type ATPase [Methylocella silvestris]ACK51821.1 heavy metal translocating P-type ATPase [Methylocella silvestris BL2]